MTAADYRLVPVALAAWVAALFLVFVPHWALFGAGVSLLGAVSVGVVARRRAHPEGAAWGLPVVALCAAAAVSLGVAGAQPARDLMARLDGVSVEAVMTVTSSSSVGSDGRLWFDADTSAVVVAGEREQIRAPVRVGVETSDPRLFALGTVIQVRGQVMATDAGERAAAVIFTHSAEVVTPAQGVFAVAAETRAAFVARAIRLPEPGAGLLPGLAVGDTTAVSAELNDAMLTSGLSHLTAVSGANCAIVVGAVFIVVALCRGGRALRVIISLAALAAFVIVVTPEPSVIRAGTMAALAMLSILFGKPRAGVGMLSLAVTIILLVDPWLASTPGFALSAAATAALVVLAPPLARGLQRWMPRPLAIALSVPISAHLVCAPIIALFSERQSLIGIAANLLAEPAAPIATIAGMLACVAAPIGPLADFFAAVAWLPASWIATTATTTAALPAAQVLVVPGIATAAIVAVLSIAVGVLLVRGKRAPPLVLWRRGAVVVLTIAVALGGARALLMGPLAPLTAPERWAIAACDVGQGDGFVVRSAGQVAVIDTGPDPALLTSCLTTLGVGRITLLVLTHFDADHAGGVAAVAGRVDTVLYGPFGLPEHEAVIATLQSQGADAVAARPGMHGPLGDATWRVLFAGGAGFSPGNDSSVIIDVHGGGVPSALFLGDLSADPMRALMRTGLLAESYAVVKVAHHGSADQEFALYQQVRPAVALISVGADNDYGHPRTETLDTLGALGTSVLRTDECGLIVLALTGDDIAVWRERAPPAGAGVGGAG